MYLVSVVLYCLLFCVCVFFAFVCPIWRSSINKLTALRIMNKVYSFSIQKRYTFNIRYRLLYCITVSMYCLCIIYSSSYYQTETCITNLDLIYNTPKCGGLILANARAISRLLRKWFWCRLFGARLA